jgi:hypothetical protein
MNPDTTDADRDELHTADLFPRDDARDGEIDRDDPADSDAADSDSMTEPRDEMMSETGESGDRAAAPRDTDADDDAPVQLLDDAGELEARWVAIQGHFVDEPRKAVEDADALVADVMRRLAESFAGEREHMEEGWHEGGEVSTEDLRVALRRYRSFFQRLLAA